LKRGWDSGGGTPLGRAIGKRRKKQQTGPQGGGGVLMVFQSGFFTPGPTLGNGGGGRPRRSTPPPKKKTPRLLGGREPGALATVRAVRACQGWVFECFPRRIPYPDNMAGGKTAAHRGRTGSLIGAAIFWPGFLFRDSFFFIFSGQM